MPHPMPSGIVTCCHRACGARTGAHKQPRAPLPPASQCGWGLGACGPGSRAQPPATTAKHQPNTSQTPANHAPRENAHGPRNRPAEIKQALRSNTGRASPQGRRQQNDTGLSLPHFVSGDTRNANRQLKSTEMSSNHWKRHS